MFKIPLDFSEVASDDSVLLLPCEDSTIFRTPADLDASVALSSQRVAYCADVVGQPGEVMVNERPPRVPRTQKLEIMLP